MPSIEKQIRASIESFVVELNALVRQAAVEAVQAALGGDQESNVDLPTGERRPKGAGAEPARVRRSRRAKRSPQAIGKLQHRLLDEIARRPGQRIEAIGRALGVPTKDLNLPIKKLLRDKRIKKKGEKRATEYSAA